MQSDCQNVRYVPTVLTEVVIFDLVLEKFFHKLAE